MSVGWQSGPKLVPNWFKKISSLKFEFVLQTCVNDEVHQSSFSLKHTMTVSLNDILSNVDVETHDPRTENNNHLKTYETQLLPGCSGSTEPFSQSVLQLFYCGLSRCYQSSPLLPPVQMSHSWWFPPVCVCERRTLWKCIAPGTTVRSWEPIEETFTVQWSQESWIIFHMVDAMCMLNGSGFRPDVRPQCWIL